MHPARLVPAFGLAILLTIALAACSAGQAPGWTYAPPPSATPLASVAPSGAPASGAPASGAPASGAPASGAPASGAPASGAPASAPASAATGGTVLTEVASGVQFQTTSLDAPAGQPFQIAFDNQDPSIPHNIEVLDGSGAKLFEGDTVTGPGKTTYSVPALAAGTYKFVCKWHPNMVGQLTAK